MRIVILVNIRLFNIFVYRGRSSVSEQRFVIQIVVSIVPESRAQASGLVKKPLVVHSLFRRGLSLTQRNLFGDVPICVALLLWLLDTCSFHTIFSYDFSLWLSPDSISFSFSFLNKSILIRPFLKHTRFMVLFSSNRVIRAWRLRSLPPYLSFSLPYILLLLPQSLRHQISLVSFSLQSHLSDLLLLFDSLCHFQSLLDFRPLFCLLPGLSLCGVQGINELSVPLVYCGILETPAVRLKTHMEGNSVSCGILPIWNTSRNFPIFLILSCELPWRRSQNHRWRLIRSSWNLLMLVLWRLQRINLMSRYLNNPLHSPRPYRALWRIPQKMVTLLLLMGRRCQKRGLILPLDDHIEFLRRFPHIFLPVFIVWPR